MSNIIYHDFNPDNHKTLITIADLCDVEWNIPITIYKNKRFFHNEKGQPDYECDQFGIHVIFNKLEEGIKINEIFIWHETEDDFTYVFNHMAFACMLGDYRAALISFDDYIHSVTEVFFQMRKELY